MPKFSIVVNSRDQAASQFEDKWTEAEKFESRDRIVDINGNKVEETYSGRKYQIIAKRVRKYSDKEFEGRRFLAVLATVLTLGLALLSKTVRKGFTKRSEARRIAIDYIPPKNDLHSLIIPASNDEKKPEIKEKSSTPELSEDESFESPSKLREEWAPIQQKIDEKVETFEADQRNKLKEEVASKSKEALEIRNNLESFYQPRQVVSTKTMYITSDISTTSETLQEGRRKYIKMQIFEELEKDIPEVNNLNEQIYAFSNLCYFNTKELLMVFEDILKSLARKMHDSIYERTKLDNLMELTHEVIWKMQSWNPMENPDYNDIRERFVIRKKELLDFNINMKRVLEEITSTEQRIRTQDHTINNLLNTPGLSPERVKELEDLRVENKKEGKAALNPLNSQLRTLREILLKLSQ